MKLSELPNHKKYIDNVSGIYLIACKMPDKVMYYVGSAENLYSRLNDHKIVLNCNNHDNKKVTEAYNTYGLDSFYYFILQKVDEKDLIPYEQLWLNKFVKTDRSKVFNKKLKVHKLYRYGRPTPLLYNVITKEYVYPVASQKLLSKTLNCSVTSVSYFINNKRGCLKGYIKVEEFPEGLPTEIPKSDKYLIGQPKREEARKRAVIQRGLDSRKPSPRLINIKTGEIFESQPSRKIAAQMLNIPYDTFGALMMGDHKTSHGWKIYNELNTTSIKG